MRACLKCKYLTNDEICPICHSPTSENWIGLLIVLNPEKSEIAKKANIKIKGKYALSVKE
ncbi:Transcription elongation factor Spt4 [Methanocaldococcus lauensis]|uniref:Transcription elongation factor Spt4 n=1 Tax=Methanocaldococcus lauensis TaxID=2546128 RepID=A0A8D6PXB4_9EURY|nr:MULTISPECIES: transcription elongation factor subunit Spt4 [Methanocaldococcus]MCQ6254594.1 DNA-directed RNA polymerase, subunit E'' [Methanocaldococcus sp.]CAB3287299.1 Transcription elongation factor Spt4 [Methanocaldococcus lauensis]CAB3289743.1 Transcription elongation factor Spt4 [Methanocaldococcus lauensis]